MLLEIIHQIRTALILLGLMTLLTGLLYPVTITAIAQILFPQKANGSLVTHHGKVVGSNFIGQSFTTAHYFWSRPSATSPFPYNMESTGSNMGPSNPLFLDTLKKRIHIIRDAMDNENTSSIPVDLVTASGSGLDPDISPMAALYQVPRIAKARNIPEKDLKNLIIKLTQGRTFGILGEPRINVLELNLALDSLGSNN